MSLLRSPSENFYPGVNLEFLDRLPSPSRQQDLEKCRAFPSIKVLDMKKYVGFMKVSFIFLHFAFIFLFNFFIIFFIIFLHIFSYSWDRKILSFRLGSRTFKNSKLSPRFRNWENSGLSCFPKHRPQGRGEDMKQVLYFLACSMNWRRKG